MRIPDVSLSSTTQVPINRLTEQWVIDAQPNYARSDMLVGNHQHGCCAYANLVSKGLGKCASARSGLIALSRFYEADIEEATNAFNLYYYSTARRIYFESHLKFGKVSAIWTQANLYDVMVSQYQRTGDPDDYQLCLDILEGNRIQYANYDWDNGVVWFIYDDIMWWVISRNLLLTHDEKYLICPSGLNGMVRFFRIKDNGSYDPVHGGMYWHGSGKSEGSPHPTWQDVMYQLSYCDCCYDAFNATTDSTYFYKVGNLHWANNNLFDKNSGRVPDSKHGNRLMPTGRSCPQSGTCIDGYDVVQCHEDRKYLDDAVLTANYTKNQMSKNEYLHF